jgi:hypothetical protein
MVKKHCADGEFPRPRDNLFDKLRFTRPCHAPILDFSTNLKYLDFRDMSSLAQEIPGGYA